MVDADTRARILRVALDEFAARGYHATSVREIAERVGVTKTAVLYHFPGKADILSALAAPMLAAMEAAVGAAELADPADAPRVVIAGLLDVWIAHRYLIRLNLHDLALSAATPVFDRFRDAMLRANALVAGPHPDLAARVRAAQSLAMLGDPVVLLADEPPAAVRAAVLDGVRRLLGPTLPGPSPGASGPRGTGVRGRGRPRAVGAEMAAAAREMYEAGRTAEEIAAALGVSRATAYRHLRASLDD